MKLNFAGKIRVGYMTAFVLLLISYALTFYTNRQLIEQNRLVNHTNIVLTNLALLFSNVKDAETGFRGYVITKDEVYLNTYYPSHAHCDSLFKSLVYLTSDNQLQQDRLKELNGLINARYQLISDGIINYKKTGTVNYDPGNRTTFRGRIVMDSIRNLIGVMQVHETDLLNKRITRLKAFANAIKAINILSFVFAILLAIYSVITFNRENNEKNRAYQTTIQFQKQLMEKVNDLNRINKEVVELKTMEKFATTGRLARTIAHEVRNPLTNIGLAAEQISEENPGEEEKKVLMEMISRNVTRINQLITELLNSTKFSELDFNIVQINDLVDFSLKLAEDRMQLKQIQLQKNYYKTSCSVSVDTEKMKLAFLNIIVNAIEAMEMAKGVLTISTVRRANKCIITFTDNGPGIDDETIPKLFEPYFTNKPQGNGLGLTNTQGIILNHKGSIDVESKVGDGTSFIVSLNVA